MKLNYSRRGQGPFVLLLHGFLEDKSMWNSIAPNGFELVAFDLPGHGESPHSTYASIDEIAAFIKAQLREFGVNEYAVIGHSMGGYIALALKELDPQCGKVILLNSTYKGDSDQKKLDRQRVAELVVDHKSFFIEQAIPGLFKEPEKYTEAVQDLIRKADRMTPGAIAQASIAMSKRIDHRELFNRFKNEIILVQGQFDPLISAETMREEQLLLHFPYHELPASHMTWVEIPDECRELLEQILSDRT